MSNSVRQSGETSDQRCLDSERFGLVDPVADDHGTRLGVVGVDVADPLELSSGSRTVQRRIVLQSGVCAVRADCP